MFPSPVVSYAVVGTSSKALDLQITWLSSGYLFQVWRIGVDSVLYINPDQL